MNTEGVIPAYAGFIAQLALLNAQLETSSGGMFLLTTDPVKLIHPFKEALMIGRSTPWSITWIEDEIRLITFTGEWTLEPKFYLLLPANPCWDGSNISINLAHFLNVLARFKKDAQERGWHIVIEQGDTR